jgi:hypothetical protein
MLQNHPAVSLACVIICSTGGEAELFAILYTKICSKNSS